MSGNPTLHLDHVDTGPLRFGPADVLAAARRFWDAMQDVQNAAMPMPHDGYLKLYQLSKPDLRKYDVILLDEAQDTNPCLFQIFNRQQTGRVLVGDAHQNIYTFRGAMNAMDRLDGERHALTASFRFGSAIAGVANALLGTFKNEPLTLEGRGGPSTRGPASGDLQTVYLHRTNAGLIERGIGLLQANARARIHFVGGAYNDHFETLLDAWRLMDGEHGAIRDPFLRAFNSIGDLEDYAEATEDREIQARLSVVKKYTDRLPGLLDQLTAADEADPARAVASLTTAHKAKGMEWEQVVLGEDFPATMDERRLPLTPSEIPKNAEANPLSADEANLIYVAATRARRQLAPDGSLGDLLEWSARHPRAVPKRTLPATPRPRAGRRELAVPDAAPDGLLRLV
jgi:superfamily I DNA/RNA helicase